MRSLNYLTLLRSALVIIALALSGCANFYLDGAVQELPAQSLRKPAEPPPTQVFFEFQTKGVFNEQATRLLKDQTLELVRSSGMFRVVDQAAPQEAAKLTITLNNVPLTSDAFAQGFVSGLTFGLAGASVSDGYVCTMEWVPAAGGAPARARTRHALHMTTGTGTPPSGALKVDSAEAGVRTMVRQIVSHGLDSLSRDPVFPR